MAAAKGNEYAARRLCDFIFKDVLGEDAYRECLLRQADKGYGMASFNLAFLYERKGDYQKAGELHLKNARNGDCNSIVALAFYPKQKLPCEARELDKMVAQAAARHDPVAESLFAQKLQDTGDIRTFTTFLMRAVMDDCPRHGLHAELGYIYLYGVGVRRDSDFAVDLFTQEIQHQNWQYCQVLGELLANGSDGVRKDLPSAVEFFKLGAKHGVKGCQEKLEEIQRKEEQQEK
jgi:TPR repeat protein